MTPEDQERLETFDKMYQGVLAGLEETLKRMDQLKKQGKKSSATYRQLMVQKLTYKNMIELFSMYGIKD